MKCPYCGAQDTKVIDSRPADDNSAIRRAETVRAVRGNGLPPMKSWKRCR